MGPVWKRTDINADELPFSKCVTDVDLWGHLEHTEIVMGEETEDRPQKAAHEPMHSADFTHMTN